MEHPITKRRRELGISAYRLAKVVDTSTGNITAIERGATKNPGVRLAFRIADALKADARALFPEASAPADLRRAS